MVQKNFQKAWRGEEQEDERERTAYIVPLEGEEDEAAQSEQSAGAEGDDQGGVGRAGDLSRGLGDGGLAGERRGAGQGERVDLGSAPEAGKASLRGSGGDLDGLAPGEGETGNSWHGGGSGSIAK